MRISGFSFVRNADKFYYPIKESISSILPIVDEFVVALGNCDSGDRTAELIESINSPKIKIINTVWDLEKYPNGTEYAHQTNIAKDACTGDWLFYLQSDEVIHEKDLDKISKRCEQLKDDKEVEGLLFRYLHFWGDYKHYHKSHSWYANEIRMVKNIEEIYSWRDAQSFRFIPDFNGNDFGRTENTRKLQVAAVDADIYHYGWVRPPQLMQTKKKTMDTHYKSDEIVNEIYKEKPAQFDYGYLGELNTFKGTHPKVMEEMVAKFNWGAQLNYTNKDIPNEFKHQKFLQKLLSFIENKIFRKQVFGFRNWKLISK